MAKKSPLAEAEAFFYKHAEFGYDPKKETEEQGRRSNAKELALAERDAASLGISFEWGEDPNPDVSWMDKKQLKQYRDGDFVMMQCASISTDGHVVGSLGGIHMGSDWRLDPYRRVIEAQLATEALGALGEDIKTNNPKPKDIDAFTRAYIEAALWSSNDESDESGGEPMDKNYAPADIAASTLKKMIADCKKFQKENAEDLETYNGRGSVDVAGGHNFWLTHERHGSGYWDGDYPEAAGERLTKAAHKFGENGLCVGDDGKIYHERE